MTATRVTGRNALTQATRDVERTDEPAARIELTYTCPLEHVTTVTLWAEADIPETWKCRVCSRFAALPEVKDPETGQWRPAGVPYWEPKSHLEQLHERRSHAELEALLNERLELLRARRGARL